MFERIFLSAMVGVNSLAAPITPVNPLELDLTAVRSQGRSCASVDIYTAVNPNYWNPQTDVVVGSLNEGDLNVITPTNWLDEQFDNAPGTTNTYFPIMDKPSKVVVTVKLVRNGRTISSERKSISTKCFYFRNT